MRIEPAFNEGDNVLHFTNTLLGSWALCGERVLMIGTPDNGVPCDECNRLAEEGGADLSDCIWLKAMMQTTYSAENKQTPRPDQISEDIQKAIKEIEDQEWPYD